jgi:hypothetical protein
MRSHRGDHRLSNPDWNGIAWHVEIGFGQRRRLEPQGLQLSRGSQNRL